MVLTFNYSGDDRTITVKEIDAGLVTGVRLPRALCHHTAAYPNISGIPLVKVISERFSCRDFRDRMPKAEILDAIAQAAIQAPSGMNRQYWHVIVIKNKDIISEMDAEGRRTLKAPN